VSVADEGALDKSGDALVVFDNQHVHEGVRQQSSGLLFTR
jgi:hypothetical protein